MSAELLQRSEAVLDDGSLEVFHGGSGATIVTAHHYVTNTAYPSPWVRGLLQSGQVFALNPRDGGGSSPAADYEHLTMRQLVEDIEAWRTRHLGGRRICVAGTSTGGFIALMYALKYPGAVMGLIVNAAAPSWRYVTDPSSIWCPANPHFREVTAAWCIANETQDLDAVARFRQVMVGHSLKNPADAEGLRADPAQTGLAQNRLNSLQRELSEGGGWDVTNRLGDIRAPTLVMCGRADSQCPLAHSEAIANGIPAASLVIFEKSGHFNYWEEPEKFARTVADFVQGLDER
jgi:proline iminopeptidase